MKYPIRLSAAVHILAFLALHPGTGLTSGESVHTNPAYVRQLMSALRGNGLLTSAKGYPRPALSRSLCKITLLEPIKRWRGKSPFSIRTHISIQPAG